MENKRILIAPFAAALCNGNPNAKNPSVRWWEDVITKLLQHGFEVTQIGGIGEARFADVSQHLVNWPLMALVETIKNHDCWVSVDSFLPHLCWAYKLKSGVVVWSQSDPLIFGHNENVNLLKSRSYLRPLQFQDWISAAYNEDAFVSPEEVVDAVNAHLARTQSPNGTRTISTSLQLAQISSP
jgi:ADP-heptose:LPS heptosyltransferase